jgi:sporulation protein YlmC with PRC-barrel domain
MAENDVAVDETDRLIASNKVEGTVVYNRQGERLGTVHNFMVDKRSGEVEYAVLSSGGLFGMGGDHYPLPWKMLTYDTAQGGYVVDLDKDVLESAPHYQSGEEPGFDREYDRAIYSHYGLSDAGSDRGALA